MFHRHHYPLRDSHWHDETGGPRILIEDPDGAAAWANRRVLREAGYRVATCDGPSNARHIDCPVLEGDNCELADAADIIVSNVRTMDGGAALIDALREAAPDRPVLREMTDQEMSHHPEFAGTVTPLPFPARRIDILETVAAALA